MPVGPSNDPGIERILRSATRELIAPSGCDSVGDLTFYRRLRRDAGQRGAWITNGVSTWKKSF